MLDLDKAVGAQRLAGLHQIDDVPAQPDDWRQLDSAVEIDYLGLYATRGEMAAGDFRVFRRDPDVARPTAVLARDPVGGRGDGNVAMSDFQIQRRVYFGIVELHQHIVAGDTKLRRAKGDEGCDIKAAHAD